MIPPPVARTDMVRPSVFDGLYSYEKVVLVCRGILFLLLKKIATLDLRATTYDGICMNRKGVFHEPRT
jgi:hypothetical protein